MQIDKVSALGIFEEEKKPNHVLINEYLSGQGIMVILRITNPKYFIFL